MKRNQLNIEKSHSNDAFVISNGINQNRITCVYYNQKRRNNRHLQMNKKGQEPSIRKQRYKIQTKDIIEVEGLRYESMGCFNKGNYVRAKRNGKNFNIPIKKIKKNYHVNGWISMTVFHI